MLEVVLDGGDEFADTAKHPAAETFLRELTEPALDEIEPGCAGRGEVKIETRMGRQPGPHGRMFMGAVVVQNEVEVQATGKGAVELAKKLQNRLMPMPPVALADDLTGQHVQCSEQGRRAVALVVMCERPTAALLHREPGLGPVQRLNLTLLVHTQHDGFLGRIHVEPHDVRELLHERGIGGQLERLHSMGLEAMRVPDPLHG